jgi:hypothetical protein
MGGNEVHVVPGLKIELKEGVKYDGEKARFDLIPPGPLEALADIYTYGAGKYEDRNWEKGIKWGRVFGAIMRHLWAFWRGEDVDEESGRSHLAHAAWGCFALLEYSKTQKSFDDRPGRKDEDISTDNGKVGEQKDTTQESCPTCKSTLVLMDNKAPLARCGDCGCTFRR